MKQFSRNIKVYKNLFILKMHSLYNFTDNNLKLTGGDHNVYDVITIMTIL